MTKEIIGNGDMAEALQYADNDVLFFASGVSNSGETRGSEFQRERDLLLSQPRDKRLVYIGSLSVFYSDNAYTEHKREMEELIKEEFPSYCILRIGTITWGDNPNTIINALKSKVENEEPFQIQDVYRYVTTEEDFLHWVKMIPDFNCEINIPGERMKVRELVKRYVL